jgi:phosphoesterase RecJ-like protein
MRSRGATDVARVAIGLGGGGHRQAAGYTSRVDREATVEALRAGLAPGA